MKLGELIKYLEGLNKDTEFVIGWELGKTFVYGSKQDSIAFSPKVSGLTENMLYEAKSILGKTYRSNDGKIHTINKNTKCYMAKQYCIGVILSEQLLESLRKKEENK